MNFPLVIVAVIGAVSHFQIIKPEIITNGKNIQVVSGIEKTLFDGDTDNGKSSGIYHSCVCSKNDINTCSECKRTMGVYR